MASSSLPSSTTDAGRRPPVLGVVIVSFNTRDLLDRCLTVLQADLAASGLLNDSAVWVVDNASTDGSAQAVAKGHPWVHLVALGENRGFTAGNNEVLARWLADPGACPNWVLLLNPDTEVQPGAVRALIAGLAGHPEAGLAGPALRYPDGRFQHAAFRFPGAVQTWLDLVPVARLADSPVNGRYPRRRYAAGTPFRVDFPLGACLLARGEALLRVGGLDEGYFMYCEEMDWAQRFQRAGYRALCVPGAEVTHHAGASTSQFRDAMFVQLWRSRRRYFARYAGPVQRRAVAMALRAGLAVRRWQDRRSARAGRIPAEERDRRAAAYRRVLAEDRR
jgi:N-acetylglucosaminyl-diphospho-decaprenol L-rhamnosyltransferase